jgi:two-component system sensor histidine kinase KdpD
MTEKDQRPDPDTLLARVQAEEAASRRGKLKIFFGYAAGVGKTYAMLEAARRERADGVDVVVGYVETHGRPETEALLEGLEILPPLKVSYRGITLREFDLDAALARRPQLLLVDELAHTNAPGLRHAKRWQDVEELLQAGIHVWTTLNVQHVESLNDIVAQITGVVVRETVPDAVLEQATEIELIDLTPEELLERLREGKVYVPQQAEQALQHFFQKTNLVALRELALRQVAQRVHREVQSARQERAATAPWATSERLLVCVSPSPTSAKLIRTAKRMASAFAAEWWAVSVAPAGEHAQAVAARQRLGQHLRLAEQLGAQTQMLIGADIAQTLLDFARAHNVTKILVGKTSQPRWKRFLFGTVVDALVDRSGDIDVYIIRGEEEPPTSSSRLRMLPPTRAPVSWSHYLWTALVVALCALVGWASQGWELSQANVAMIFLLGVAYVAARYGRGPAIAASLASVLVFDFFFVPPYLSFAVSDAQYLLTFMVMLIIGLLISHLTVRLREQLHAAQQLGQRTTALFHLTRQLSQVAGLDFLLSIAGKQLQDIFKGEVVIYYRKPSGELEVRYGQRDSPLAQNDKLQSLARWVADRNRPAGAGTDILPSADAFFVPLIGSQRTVGVVGIRPADPQRFADPDQRQLLETCASLIALALERDQSTLEAHEAQRQIEAEQIRNSLLNSVSHELRTPLAAIGGAAGRLLELLPANADGTQRELLQTIVDESAYLARLVDKLLEMSRLVSGTVTLNRQWHVLEEIVGSACQRLKRELAGHVLHIDLPGDLPLLYVDGLLLEQVFFNLLENAARHTPPGSQISLSARRINQHVEIRVADNGPGLPAGTETRIFEKFFRADTPGQSHRGVGLGLAICQTILRLHGGDICARNRPEGGAEFLLHLPCEQQSPSVPLDEAPAHVPA